LLAPKGFQSRFSSLEAKITLQAAFGMANILAVAAEEFAHRTPVDGAGEAVAGRDHVADLDVFDPLAAERGVDRRASLERGKDRTGFRRRRLLFDRRLAILKIGRKVGYPSERRAISS
jgi:hypothetical protein